MAQWNCVIPAWASRGVITPLDSLMTADELADVLHAAGYPVVAHITADPVTERYQGGGYTAIEYSRATPSPRDPFALED